MRSDEALLDFLEQLNDKAEFTGKCILRMSENGRGWRLHESYGDGTSISVRNAINEFMDENSD